MNKKEKDLHLLSLPVFVLLTLSFWILGGGTGGNEETSEADSETVNMELPIAADKQLASGRLDAMRTTEEQEDRQRRRLHMQESSFDWLDAAGQQRGNTAPAAEDQSNSLVSFNTEIPADMNSVKTSAASPRPEHEAKSDRQKRKEEIMRKKRERLEAAFGVDLASYGSKAADTLASEAPAEAAAPESSAPRRGFYGLEGDDKFDDGHIKAVVHGLHKDVTNGSVIKLRLLENVLAGTVKIPRNTFVYGKLSFSSGRAMVRIENINFRDRIVPFSGSIYDRDGFEGLYVPDNIVSDTKKDAAGQAISSADIKLSSPVSMLNSAANAVTGAVKSAASSSVREVKITISSNYLITIKRDKE